MRGFGRVLVAAFLLLGLLFTLLRALQSEAGLAVRLVSFTPIAVLLYLCVLAVCLPLWLATLLSPGRGGWQIDAVIALVALAGIGLHGWWLSPQFTGSHPAAADDAVPIRVLTLNLFRGSADGLALLDTAVREKVDLLVLEEVTPGILSSMRDAGLDEAFPHHAGGPGPDVGGTMVFATAPITEVTRLATDFGSWSMEVALPQGPVRVFAVHPRPPTGSTEAWAAELSVIADAVAAEHPDVVAGDFNATRDHRPFRRILAAGTTDVAERLNAGWQPTWPANGTVHLIGLPLPRLVQIDHVLIGPTMAALRLSRVSIADADHAGVLAEIGSR
jgi:endonuclease/exonuclease/phosphatase (EEP) superfamily protein YafD